MYTWVCVCVCIHVGVCVCVYTCVCVQRSNVCQYRLLSSQRGQSLYKQVCCFCVCVHAYVYLCVCSVHVCTTTHKQMCVQSCVCVYIM